MDNEKIELVGTEVKISLGFEGVGLKVTYDIDLSNEDVRVAAVDAENISQILKAIVEDFLADYEADGQEVDD